MVAAVKAYALSLPITAVVVDTAAEKVALYAMGVTGIVVLWRNVARPFGQLLKAGVHIVKKTADAVNVLEHLPDRWRESDERVSSLEAEVGIAHTEIHAVDAKVDSVDEKVVGIANDIAAIRREFSISDDKVRTPPQP